MDDLWRRRRDGAGDVFFAHAETTPSVEDCFSPFVGLYAMPTIVFYGGHYPRADLLSVVRASPKEVPLKQLPQELATCLAKLGLEQAYEFFWVVSDASDIIARHGTRLNVNHHAWVFQDELMQCGLEPRFRQQGQYPMGAFTYRGSNVEPTQLTCLPFQMVDRLRVSVHTQAGGICCSPNNAKFSINPLAATPVSTMWTLVADPARRRACVSLQWIVCRPEPRLLPAIRAAQSVADLFASFSALFASQPCLTAVQVAFGAASPDALGPPTTPALPTTIPNKGKRQGGAPPARDAACGTDEGDSGGGGVHADDNQSSRASAAGPARPAPSRPHAAASNGVCVCACVRVCVCVFVCVCVCVLMCV
jgi:hypothetical protein